MSTHACAWPPAFIPTAYLAIALAACGNDPTNSVPPSADVHVSATTTGVAAALDPDGYVVAVDNGLGQAIATNGGSLDFSDLSLGDHFITLGDVAINCNVVDPFNPVHVAVQWGQRVDVAFKVQCATVGAIQVSVATTGSDLPVQSYKVAIAGLAPGSVAPNGSVTFTFLHPGDYGVSIGSLPSNCTVTGSDSVVATVVGYQTTHVNFAVACLAFPRIRFTTATTGTDFLDCCTARVDGGSYGQLAANGAAIVKVLSVGDHMASVGVPPNCAVTSATPVTVSVAWGDTAAVDFAVTCTATNLPVGSALAYLDKRDGSPDIYLIRQGDQPTVNLTADSALIGTPVWSPDGTRIAFLREYAGITDIYAMNADGSGRVRVVSGYGLPVPNDPVWSPDGTELAFASGDEIYVVGADGSALTNVTRSPSADRNPSWSSSGKIAFASDRSGNFDIYVMNPDGTGVIDVSNNTAQDSLPVWSPDGTKIAFSSNRDPNVVLFVMNADGSSTVGIPSSLNLASVPVWSPDGARIAYQAGGIWLANMDGSGTSRLLTTNISCGRSTCSGTEFRSPAWSPDGTTLAYVRRIIGPCRSPACVSGIGLIHPDGSGLEMLTNTSSDNAPAWRP